MIQNLLQKTLLLLMCAVSFAAHTSDDFIFQRHRYEAAFRARAAMKKMDSKSYQLYRAQMAMRGVELVLTETCDTIPEAISFLASRLSPSDEEKKLDARRSQLTNLSRLEDKVQICFAKYGTRDNKGTFTVPHECIKSVNDLLNAGGEQEFYSMIEIMKAL